MRELFGAAGRWATVSISTPPKSIMKNMTREMNPPVRPVRFGDWRRGGFEAACDERLSAAGVSVPGPVLHQNWSDRENWSDHSNSDNS